MNCLTPFLVTPVFLGDDCGILVGRVLFRQRRILTADVVVEEGDEGRTGVVHGLADLVVGGFLVEVDGLLVGEVEGQHI